MKAIYNVEDLIDIMFNQMETGQEFKIAENSPFYDQQLVEMGIERILVIQEYTDIYRMWKSIAANDWTWVQFKAHLQEAYLERKELYQTTGSAVYESINNEKHGKMEDAFMNFSSATASWDAVFTEMTRTNGNLYTQLRQQEEQIRALQV